MAESSYHHSNTETRKGTMHLGYWFQLLPGHPTVCKRYRVEWPVSSKATRSSSTNLLFFLRKAHLLGS